MIGVIIIFVIGMILGSAITVITLRKRSFGSLRIDTSDPNENPYIFLELSEDVNTIFQKKYITLKINTQNFVSQE